MYLWRWFQPISFQVIWFAAVLGGNHWLAVPLGLLGLHFVLTPSRVQDFKVLSLAIIGLTIDVLLTQLGIFEFSETPVWLCVLWAAFVLNFGHSLQFLRKLNSYWLIALGAAGGCYAYIASWQLGAVNFPLSLTLTALALALNWAIIFPLLVKADLYLRGNEYA